METIDRDEEPTRDEVNALPGPVLIEFGASWCPHCQAIQPALRSALERHPGVKHIKVADGKGKPLGRSFAVRLWPNFVFLRDGQVVQQLARPSDVAEIENGLEAISERVA